MNSFHRFHWSRLTRTLSTSYVTSNVIISPLISPGSRYFWFIDSCVGFHGKNPYGSLIVDSHNYNGPFTSLIMDSGHFSFQWHSVQQHRKMYRYSNHWQEFPHQTSLQTVCAKAKAHKTGKDSTKTQPWHELRKYIYSPARTHTHTQHMMMWECNVCIIHLPPKPPADIMMSDIQVRECCTETADQEQTYFSE